MEKLNLFFSAIRGLNFWQRLFYWRPIRNLSYDAYREFKSMQDEVLNKTNAYDLNEKRLAQAIAQNGGLQNNIQQYERSLYHKDQEVNSKNNKIEELNTSINGLNIAVSKYEGYEHQRRENYEKSISQLNQLKTTLEHEIKRLSDERLAEQKELFEKMKRQWSEHEVAVEQALRMICRDHLVKYVEHVPFRGNPDNTLEICDEYIIFDAKCPSNDDLTNFPKYIKAQTEIARKYALQEKVKKDIFLVIPANAVHTISQLIYNMGDYTVYVITKDALEPIILALKRIEDYEFVNQLSPDERDNICRVIGKFAHTTKRKIQVDQFFAAEFLELLSRCKNDLPEDILKQVIEFEKAERLNPPSEQKAKQIPTKKLEEKHFAINAEAGIRNVIIPLNFEQLKNLE